MERLPGKSMFLNTYSHFRFIAIHVGNVIENAVKVCYSYVYRLRLQSAKRVRSVISHLGTFRHILSQKPAIIYM